MKDSYPEKTISTSFSFWVISNFFLRARHGSYWNGFSSLQLTIIINPTSWSINQITQHGCNSEVFNHIPIDWEKRKKSINKI